MYCVILMFYSENTLLGACSVLVATLCARNFAIAKNSVSRIKQRTLLPRIMGEKPKCRLQGTR